ncbi:MAG: hypothetical protein OEZ68_16360 [Gammaproteobacteria bacterium]|nr:hypothetical protein [Gammaproteobacteria bacterium]MDH5802375.1 hypothetical protein [Gammaproteobacteria bacterium]
MKQDSNIVDGIDNEHLYNDIRQRLKPLLRPTTPNDEVESIQTQLRERCDQILTPFREFLESEIASLDYKYNDIIGFEEGKWSAEIKILLTEGAVFTGNDIELLNKLGKPIWVLVVEISVISPVYLMAIEKWEIDKSNQNWIECTPANDRLNDFLPVILACELYFKGSGFHPIHQESLSIRLPRNITNKELCIGEDREDFTLVQLLFNELFNEDIDILNPAAVSA